MYRTAETGLEANPKKATRLTHARRRTASERSGDTDPGTLRENDTYDVHNKDAAAVTGTRAHSGDTKKFSVRY